MEKLQIIRCKCSLPPNESNHFHPMIFLRAAGRLTTSSQERRSRHSSPTEPDRPADWVRACRANFFLPLFRVNGVFIIFGRNDILPTLRFSGGKKEGAPDDGQDNLQDRRATESSAVCGVRGCGVCSRELPDFGENGMTTFGLAGAGIRARP